MSDETKVPRYNVSGPYEDDVEDGQYCRAEDVAKLKTDLARVRAERDYRSSYPNHCYSCERPCTYEGPSERNGALRCKQCLRVEKLEATLKWVEDDKAILVDQLARVREGRDEHLLRADLACEERDNSTAGWVKVKEENARLRGILREVMSWISNWSPSFTDDGEWAETKRQADEALKTEKNDE